MRDSPSLPQRPKTTNKSKAVENEYSLIRESSSSISGTHDPGIICDKSIDISGEYAQVVKKTSKVSDKQNTVKGDQDGTKVLPKCERDKRKQSFSNDVPEYAKVIPKSNRQSCNTDTTNNNVKFTNGTAFNVKFPNIDCGKITDNVLPEEMFRNNEQSKGPTYSNLVTRQSKSIRKVFQSLPSN